MFQDPAQARSWLKLRPREFATPTRSRFLAMTLKVHFPRYWAMKVLA
jgi:hypothetical protein